MAVWRYVKPLESEKLISEIESKLNFKFDKSYVDFVKKYNGGRPPLSVFDTNLNKGRTIKSFLSLNSDDSENIIVSNRFISEVPNEVVAFAIDNFGNYICFDKIKGRIIFMDYETGAIEHIADNFSSFLSILEGTSTTK